MAAPTSSRIAANIGDRVAAIQQEVEILLLTREALTGKRRPGRPRGSRTWKGTRHERVPMAELDAHLRARREVAR